MAELLNLLFYPLSNGIMTVLTGMSLLYWVFMFFSGDGFDTDAEFHMGDVSDGDVNTDADGEVSFGSKVLEFISIGKMPLMVIVTLFKFIGWILTLLSSIFLGLANWGIKSVLILLPVFAITFVIMHYVTKPLVKMYKNLGYNGEESIDFLGRTGTLKSTIEHNKIGILEVTIQKDVFRLNVKSQSGNRIEYGAEVMIIKAVENNIYEVQPNITLHNIN
ncbi:MAG: DUF1449 family protein [Myroides sp.]